MSDVHSAVGQVDLKPKVIVAIINMIFFLSTVIIILVIAIVINIIIFNDILFLWFLALKVIQDDTFGI